MEEAERCVKEHPGMCESPNQWGQYPLHVAALMGHDDIVELLLPVTPDGAKALATKNTYLALHYAADSGHEAVVRTLLHAHRGGASAKNDFGNLPIHLAVRGACGLMVEGQRVGSGHEGCVELLLLANGESAAARGGPENVSCDIGESFTPLHMAARSGSISIVRRLLAAHPEAAAARTESGHRPVT